MKLRKRALGILFAAALVGLTGCASNGGDTAETPAAESPAAGSSPSAAEDTETMDHESMSEDSDEGSEDGGSGMDDDAEAEGDVVITVEEFEFEGPPSVSPGATITIVNEDSAPHTVTSEEEGVFDVQFDGGETVTFTAPEEPGEYPYICTLHPAMTATLVVE